MVVGVHEAWLIFLSVCTGIITISSAAAVIIGLFKKFKQPEEDQNARLTLIEEKILSIEKRLDEHDELVVSLRESNKVTQEALWALLGHAIDGNNVDDLKKAQGKLHDRIFK